MHIDEFVKIKIKRKIIFLSICLASLVAFLVLGLLLVGFQADRVIGSTVIVFAIYLFIVFKSGIIYMLCDKTWHGTVEKLGSRTVMRFDKSSLLAKPKHEVMQITVTVKTDRGKRVKFHFDSGIVRLLRPSIYDKRDSFLPADTYPVGSRVIHYKGSRFPVLESPRENKRFCPVCAAQAAENYCEECDVSWDEIDEFWGIIK